MKRKSAPCWRRWKGRRMPDVGHPLSPRLRRVLELRMGLCSRSAAAGFMAHGLDRMARERNTDVPACVAWLTSEPWNGDKLQACARAFTVPETYFFRDGQAFALLARHAGALVAAGRSVTVWSAGCCTGEEAYSAAMALADALPAAALGKVRVLGTDVDRDSLHKARAGIYSSRSFRGGDRQRWLRHLDLLPDGRLRVSERVRALVEFHEHNLAEPGYPGPASGGAGIDMIFCRNVLLYFSQAQKRKVIARLRLALAADGWLAVSPAEAGLPLLEGLYASTHDHGTFYRKSAPARMRGSRSAAPARAPAALPVRAAPQASPQAPGPSPAAPVLPAPVDVASEAPRLEALRVAAAAALEAGRDPHARQLLRQLLYLAPTDIVGHILAGRAWMAVRREQAGRLHFALAAGLLAAQPPGAVVAGSAGLTAAMLEGAVRRGLAPEECA